MQTRYWVLIFTSAVWAAAAASAVFWLLRMVGPSAVLDRPAGAVMLVSAPVQPANAAALLTLLGGTMTQAESGSFEGRRYKLVGVVAGVRGGAALLSINDQPAKPYTVGSRIDDTNLLLAVGLRHVVLGSDIQRGGGHMLALTAE